MGYDPFHFPQRNPDIETLIEMIHKIKDVFGELTELFDVFVTPRISEVFQPLFAREKFMMHMEKVLQYINEHSQQDDFLEKLEEHGMTGKELHYKRDNLEYLIGRFRMYFKLGRRIIGRIIGPLLQIINSILESLGFILGAGAAKEIKDLIHAAITTAQ